MRLGTVLDFMRGNCHRRTSFHVEGRDLIRVQISFSFFVLAYYEYVFQLDARSLRLVDTFKWADSRVNAYARNKM